MHEPNKLTEAQARYYDDLKRLRGRRGLLLDLLMDGEWHPNWECASVGGLSFNDSFYAFRREGWLIESRPKRGGVWEFRLLGKAEPLQGQGPMSRPQRVVARHYMSVISTALGADAAAEVTDLLPEWMRSDPRPLQTDTDALST